MNLWIVQLLINFLFVYKIFLQDRFNKEAAKQVDYLMDQHRQNETRF